MNLLIDFITVSVRTGAGEYHRRVFFELLDFLNHSIQKTINLFALYDSTKGIAYDDLKPEVLSSKGVRFLDCSSMSISDIIAHYQINRFFIVCAQYLGSYDLSGIECKILCVIHDLVFEEVTYNKIAPFLMLQEPDAEEMAHRTWKGQLQNKLSRTNPTNFAMWYQQHNYYKTVEQGSRVMKNIITLYQQSSMIDFIVVSYYTRDTLVYNYDIPIEKIKVLYSPEKIKPTSLCIENTVLSQIISQKKRYFLLVSARSLHKNAIKAIRAFKRYVKHHPETLLVTVGYTRSCFPNHIDLPFLSDGDITNAFANCYALLYPSYFEGFGYPPLEAMHYAKPVLCSNTTSMPEILDNAPIYFSPFYESAIFSALSQLNDDNYKTHSELSRQQYEKVRRKQEVDLKKLLQLLTKIDYD